MSEMTPAETLRAAAARLRADEFTAMPWDEPLAAWLVDVAEEAERHGAHPYNLQEEVTHPHPIAVARAVLGGGEDGS